MNISEKTLIKKDIREITGSKQVFLPMLIVPIILMVLIPSVFILGVHFGATKMNGIDKLLSKLAIDLKGYTQSQLMLHIFLNYMFPSFSLLVPIMSSSILGASSFVGEREHKTMETLLYTPLSMENLLKAKILGVFTPAYIITLISFVAFGVVVNIGGMLEFGKIIFPDIRWLILILWMIPALTLFSLTFTVIVSAKSATFQDAQQISGLLVLPVILLLASQMTGLFLLNNLIIFVAGLLLFIIDYVLIKRISRNFKAEKLI